MVHFDIKGDNILLEMLPGMSEQDFWLPPAASHPSGSCLQTLARQQSSRISMLEPSYGEPLERSKT